LIEAGDLGRAGIQAVMLGFPDLAQDAARKLTAIADLEKAGTAWETEARVPADTSGGGQWTAGAGGAPTLAAPPAPTFQPKKQGRFTAGATRPARPKPTQRPAAPPRTIPPLRPPSRPPSMESAPSPQPIEVSVAMPVAPVIAARAVSRPNGASTIALPRAVAPISAFGLVGLVATWLHGWDLDRAQQAIDHAITRFKLDPERPETQKAAIAYVWSRSHLPALIPAN
jgi:hypothetical protein